MLLQLATAILLAGQVAAIQPVNEVRQATLYAMDTAAEFHVAEQEKAAEAAKQKYVPSLIDEGYAAHYTDGLMEQVALNRGMSVESCMISYTWPNSSRLGEWMLVESSLDGDSMWCRVTDMPQSIHYEGIKSRGIRIELNLGAARVLCNIQYAGQEPPRACPVRVYQ